MVDYLEASTNKKMYSDYLQAEKEEAMEQSCSQTADSTTKPKATIFFPLQKLKGTQPARTPAAEVVHLEEENTDKEEGAESEDPNGIECITKEIILHLSRAVKDAK